jgi:O-antigen/teichoic acid export membrane protein
MTPAEPTPIVAGPAEPASDKQHLTSRHLFSAIAWTAGAKWATQVFSWAAVFMVVRLLTPEDFGLFGMATTYLGLLTLLSEFGIGSAVVTLRNLSESELRQLHCLSVLLGLTATLLSFGAALPLSLFFKSPALAPMIAVMGTGFAISAFRSVPYALLQKDLAFRTLSWVEVVQALIQSLASVALAWAGAGYWALALSGLVGLAIGAILSLWKRPVALQWPNWRYIQHSLLFSWRILVSRISWYLYSNADFVVAGRVFGAAALGTYTVAWNVAHMPGEKIVSLVMRVTPSFFAAAQDNKAALRHYLGLLTEVLSIIMFPVLCGLCLLAPEFVHVALGDRWQGAALFIRILSIYTLLRSIVTLLPQILNVVGETRFSMWSTLAVLAVLPPSFWFATRWGMTGVAMIWVLVYPLSVIPLYHRTLTRIDMPFSSYGTALKPAIVSTLVMAPIVLGARAGLSDVPNEMVRLALCVTAGAVAYLGTMFLLFRERLNRYITFARTALKK